MKVYCKRTLLKTLLTAWFTATCLSPAAALESISAVTPQGRTVEVSVINAATLKVTNRLGDETELTANRLDSSAGDVAVSRSTIDDNLTSISTGSVTAIIDARTGALTIYGGDGRVVTDSGIRTTTGGRLEIELATTATGAYYGAGERGHSLNLRGDTLVMYNRPTYGYTGNDPRISQMNITMPLIVSVEGFALVFDDYAASTLILSDPIKYVTEAPGAVSYYFVNGVSTIADAVEQLTAITGRQDLPPLWALGYITSKYGYKTQNETKEVVRKLKSSGYPLDGVVLDLYWYGKEEDMGRLDWDPDQWPDTEKMLLSLAKEGVKVVPISQPYVLRNGKGAENYDSLAPKGIFVRDSTGRPLDVEIWVGKGGMFDVSNPDTRAWLAKRYGELSDMGVTGWWGDLGEPEKHPDEACHANGLKAREYHNRYGNDWSSIIYDLFARKYPDRRLFTLMRGGTTGLQRYSVFPWSGDVSRSWGGLEPQITIMLNSGLSGLGYMSHDVGGFALDDANPIDPELYVRWLQLGLFSPVLRTHSQEYAEPYHYPAQAGIIKRLIDERYSWLPYNYTLAYENSARGLPLVRPLNFHGSRREICDTIRDEYLWGRDILVAPVLKQGAVSRPIVFPDGRWIDMRDPRVSYTGAINTYDAPLDVIPLFVRAGAFIPHADYKMRNTSDYDPSRLTVSYYASPGIESGYTLYDDNRISPRSLAEGRYRLINFKGRCTDDGDATVCISSEGTYDGAPDKIDIDFRLPGLAAAPSSVTVNGKKTKFTYDNTTGSLSVKLVFIPGKTTEISIIH